MSRTILIKSDVDISSDVLFDQNVRETFHDIISIFNDQSENKVFIYCPIRFHSSSKRCEYVVSADKRQILALLFHNNSLRGRRSIKHVKTFGKYFVVAVYL